MGLVCDLRGPSLQISKENRTARPPEIAILKKAVVRRQAGTAGTYGTHTRTHARTHARTHHELVPYFAAVKPDALQAAEHTRLQGAYPAPVFLPDHRECEKLCQHHHVDHGRVVAHKNGVLAVRSARVRR